MTLITQKLNSTPFYHLNNQIYESCEEAVSVLENSLKSRAQAIANPNLKEYAATGLVLNIISQAKESTLNTMLSLATGDEAKRMITSVWKDVSASLHRPQFEQELVAIVMQNKKVENI